ncbi:LuxR C-terminal-related transcriptional regulator [Micromonospora avicenniae]|uniref:LuxR family transcriptional regulator, maltose regulon positive regulatory protein n=1 Tax=Micromonospora avicenniae TaxID=1198245 RepID=A0A1N7FIC2_9ACTN|nr:LuxR C-terminal-related transcriptional regulator [Micromonospora avicenniae]SIS00061.1 LuxR family transcriptional regulator, maltose regulon positive regulatory protein [Micromonospora avicenniae]
MPEQRNGARVDTADGTRPPLLASRLTPPALPEPVVARPRLLRRLDEGSAGSVTLVSAPAGWGKTTLLAAWARLAGASAGEGAEVRPDGSVADTVRPAPAWVSVEAGDDGDRLWSYVLAALRNSAEHGHEAAPMPARPPRPDQLELLAAGLARRERPMLLILDDLHRVTEPAALTGLDFLLRHAEQRLRLVVGARAGLPLAVHRLRLAGELTEIGPDELAFTDDEVADLLTAHGVTLPGAALRRLRERTGGWPAALRFAALALHRRPDPTRWVEQFGGDQPDVAGYLHEEVLAAVDPAARDLLRRTALAETVCADLADALTDGSDAERTLAELAGDGGLLRRDESRPPWYRCQPLLTDLLRAELARLPADELRELHLRAAGWYADNGRPMEGLRHALAARNWDLATEIFVAQWPELAPYDRADFGSSPPPAPPPEAVRRDPELALACAAERAYAGDAPAATAHLHLAAEHADALPTPRRDRFLRLATAVELTLARLADDHAEVRAAAARLIRPHPTAPGPRDLPAGSSSARATGAPQRSTTAVAGARGPEPLAAPVAGGPRGSATEDAELRAFAGTALGLVELAEGQLPAARFTRALNAAREAGRLRTELVCASRSALLHALRGRLRAAETSAREALAMPPCHGWACRLDCAYAHLALAVVALHRDQPEEAAGNLTLAGPATGEGQPGTTPGAGIAAVETTAVAVAALCRAQLLRDRGEVDAGHRLLVEARHRLADRPAAVELAYQLLAANADLLAARGDLAAARDLLAGPVHDQVEPLAPVAVALARVELRAGDPRAAGRVLPDWTAPAAAEWPLPVRLEAGLLDAVLARQGGDERRAGRLLEQVLDLAGPEGVRRVFTRADPAARDLLAAHLDTGTAHWSMVSDLVRGGDEPAERRPVEPGPTLDEPLTERELTILRYLQSILSNVEIASELSLSVNTVKTHVRNIYRKLDATRRREAVRRARELRLI